MIEQFVILF